MKKSFVFLFISLFLFSLCDTACGQEDTKKKKSESKTAETAKKPAAKSVSKYDKLFDKKGHIATTGGFMTLHLVDGKLYFELPLKYMGREMLLASTASESSNPMLCTNGYKAHTPRHIKFTLEDSTVYMRSVNAALDCRVNGERGKLLKEKNFIEPMLEAYEVAAWNKDRSAVVFNVTSLFTGSDADLSPVNDGIGKLTVKASPQKAGIKLDEIKAFEDNVMVSTWYAYRVSVSQGRTPVVTDAPLTVQMLVLECF